MAPIAARRDGSWGSRRASAHSRRERSTSGDDFICRRFVKSLVKSCQQITVGEIRTNDACSRETGWAAVCLPSRNRGRTRPLC